MLSVNFVIVSVVLCFVVKDVELFSRNFGPTSFGSSLFPGTTQDEEDGWEEEKETDGEDLVIAKLAQIIREIKNKYSRFESLSGPPVTEPRPVFIPDFTYHFSPPDSETLDFDSIPFAVHPNDPRFYQKDFSSNIKKQNHPNYPPPVYEETAPQIPHPRFLTPMIIKVKSDNINQKEDVSESNKWEESIRKLHPQHYNGGEESKHALRPYAQQYEEEEEQEEPVSRTHVYFTDKYDDDNMYFIALVAGCSAALLLIIVLGGYSWYKLQKNNKLAADVKYPAYAVSGVTKNGGPPASGDRRLAHSAQMYHYQHQKQQILALENNNRDQRRGSVSDVESDDEHEADHTVYECPTLPLTNKKTPDIEMKKPTVEKKPTPSLSSNTPDENVTPEKK